MQPIATNIFSDLFDTVVECQPCAHDTYTDTAGVRHPDIYQQMDMGIAYVYDAVCFDISPSRPIPQPTAIIHVSIRGISADKLDQQIAGTYQTGDMYLLTSASVRPKDRIITSDGCIWQIIERVRTVSMFTPPRSKYLIRRIRV